MGGGLVKYSNARPGLGVGALAARSPIASLSDPSLPFPSSRPALLVGVFSVGWPLPCHYSLQYLRLYY